MMKLVVLSCLLAAATASLIAPLAYTAPLAYSASYGFAAPLLASSNYRGPLSLAPGQPANVLGADGRPLDTLDVNLDRSAHLTAKAFDAAGVHLLKKRSVAPLIAPLAVAPAPLVARAPLTYAAPTVYSANIAAPFAYANAPLVQW